MKTAIGPEFIPDYRDLFANSLTVPAGTTHVLRGDVEHDAIYVDGELRFATDAPTTLRYVNLHVAAGGKLWIGDEANPMLQPVRLIKRDVALDTEFDPFQWGHGIQCFGELSVHGKNLGQTWSGDDPLHDPSAWNIVFESENPADVMSRGHIAIIHTGSANVRYASFLGMGRTTGAVIDNTPLDLSRVGLNQIAKYAFHWHHAHAHADGSHAGGHVIGCYFDGLVGNKWGIVIHGSHGMHVENNVLRGFTGSCIVTEDGDERDYLIKNNLLLDANGNGRSGKENMSAERFAPGAEGAGIWLHSPTGTTIGNVAKGCAFGYQLMYRPNPNRIVVPPRVGPTKFDDNRSVQCVTAFEEWNSPDMLIENLSCEDCTNGVVMGNAEPGSITLVNPQFAGNGKGSGVNSSAAYTAKCEIRGGRISGFRYGVRDAVNVVWDGLDVRGNATDVFFELLPRQADLDNLQFDTGRFGRQPVMAWASERPLNIDERYMPWDGEGPTIWMRNRNGDGKTVVLLATNFQDGQTPAPPQNPIPGLTRQQCWDQYGLAAMGFVFGSDAVDVPGIPLCKAVEMESFTYPVSPRVVLMAPNNWRDFSAGDKRPHVILTGGAKLAFVQFDDESILKINPTSGWPTYQRLVSHGAFTDGHHVAKTWAGDDEGIRIESSLLEFPFTIGDDVPPPPPPVDECELLKIKVTELEAVISDWRKRFDSIKAQIP